MKVADRQWRVDNEYQHPVTCCLPTSPTRSEFTPQQYAPSPSAVVPARVSIPEGLGLLGTSKPYIRTDGEGPLRRGQVAPLYMSQGAITNAEFTAFINDTGYVTEAEYLGWSFVFWSQVPDYIGETMGVPGSPWWRRVDGACWRCITGPQCTLAQELTDHPVVHVSWNDAVAYCSWVGGRLPTELEWEHAARGGLGDVRFPWGELEPDDNETFLCNIWQGRFPHTNTEKDGFYSTAPTHSFEPNGYGLFNMAGNVWDWTADRFHVASARPESEQSVRQKPEIVKLAKGGSFLCHKSYCYRYRIAARIGNAVDSATTHMGFRVVWDR